MRNGSRLYSKILPILFAVFLLDSFSAQAGRDGADTPSGPITWQDYLDMLKDNEAILEYSTVRESMDILPQYLFMTLAHAYPIFAAANPDWPEFVPYINHILNIAGPNPDVTYYFATIDGKNDYRIVGERGDVHMVELTTGYDWTGFKDKLGVSQSATSLDDFNINRDGTFEIILSSKKPENDAANWIPLDEKANFVFVRQVAYNPEEVNARIAIEKIGGPDDGDAVVDMDARLKAMIDYVKFNAKQYLKLIDEFDDNGVYNRFVAPDYSAIGGVKHQIYQSGLYDVPQGQALIIAVKIPEDCKYWNFQASDLLWQTHDFLRTQSNLNGHIDRADGDDLTRFVLSHEDPGVANWIDLNGRGKGYMLFRWVECNEDVKPAITTVAFDNISEHLPPDTKRVSLEERERALRKMSTALQLRRNW